jgi:hypothetical protein
LSEEQRKKASSGSQYLEFWKTPFREGLDDVNKRLGKPPLLAAISIASQDLLLLMVEPYLSTWHLYVFILRLPGPVGVIFLLLHYGSDQIGQAVF